MLDLIRSTRSEGMIRMVSAIWWFVIPQKRNLDHGRGYFDLAITGSSATSCSQSDPTPPLWSSFPSPGGQTQVGRLDSSMDRPCEQHCSQAH